VVVVVVVVVSVQPLVLPLRCVTTLLHLLDTFPSPAAPVAQHCCFSFRRMYRKMKIRSLQTTFEQYIRRTDTLSIPNAFMNLQRRDGLTTGLSKCGRTLGVRQLVPGGSEKEQPASRTVTVVQNLFIWNNSRSECQLCSQQHRSRFLRGFPNFCHTVIRSRSREL
jgi:hypothetical protein